MCSFGARLLLGEASSSICGTTMMDSLTNTSKGVQAVGSSLATALRDRQAYVIPIQPNRSLPVRPAPHHTPCRATIVRSSLSRPSSFVITTLQPLVIDAPRTCENPVEAVKTASKAPDELRETEEQNEASRAEEKGSEEVKEENWAKETSISAKDSTPEERPIKREPSEDHPSSEMKRKSSREMHDFVTRSHEPLIDISHSPERIDLESEVLVDEASPTAAASSPAPWGGEAGLRDKRKRRRSGGKRTGDEVREVIFSGGTETGCRTVPPLRLKKIQSLQEPTASCGSGWPGTGREDVEAAVFAPNAGSTGSAKRSKIADSFDPDGTVKEYSGNYRIVTGHTPPYEDRVDASSTTETRLDGLDAAKLRYRQSKLKLKLHELRRKAVDLGKEMLRTVLTSPRTPRGSRLRQTIDRYEEQIDDLEKLLNMLPKAGGYAEEETKWRSHADTTNVAEHEARQGFVVSPAGTSSSRSSSLCSSPSIGPPKLSPRSPTNWDAQRSPSDVRNSPPVLPRVYVTIADCREYTWDGRNSSQNRRVKRRNRSPVRKTSPSENATISTTSEAFTKRKIEIVDDEEKSDNVKRLSDVGKVDFDRASCNSVDVLEDYETETQDEKKYRVEKAAETKPPVKPSQSPRTDDIDTTSVDAVFNPKPQFAQEIGELQIDDAIMRVESPPITSTSEIAGEREKTNECNDFVTVRDELGEVHQSGNPLTIDEQFPTLGNWIAGLSRKQVGVSEANANLAVTPSGDNPPSAFQVFNAEAEKPMEPEVLQNSAPTILHDNVVAPQWRNELWQEQQDQQQPLNQPYAPALPLPPPPPPPQLGQEFCSPIAMARLYTRNYSIDPYSVTYGYNPAIAAAAATASLWNSAAILQYPLMRPSSAMINAQSSSMQSSNVQFPTRGVAQRPVYRGIQHQIAGAKRPPVDGSIVNYPQRDGILSAYACAKRPNVEFQQAVAAGQARLACNNVNGQTMNYRACLQQQQHPQQSQVPRQFSSAAYADPSMRLPVPAATWRSGPVPGAIPTGYNYSGTPGGSTAPANTLNPLSRTTPAGLAAPSTVPPINSSRTRLANGPIDTNFRNCETPHLGKVAHSPNTVSSLRCSNCGLPGSMFKCLGCGVAFYCGENCQARHWNRHVISCPKKMPKLKKLVN